MVVMDPLFPEQSRLRQRFVHLLPVEGHPAQETLLQLEALSGIAGLPEGVAVFLHRPVDAPPEMAEGFLITGDHQVQGALPSENGAEDQQVAPGLQGGKDLQLHPVQDLTDNLGVGRLFFIFFIFFVRVGFQIVQDHQVRAVWLP